MSNKDDASDLLKGFQKLKDLLGKDSLDSARSSKMKEAALEAHEVVQALMDDFSHVTITVKDLVRRIDEKETYMRSELDRSVRMFDPDYRAAFAHAVDEPYGSLMAVRKIGGEVHKSFAPAYRNWFMISQIYHMADRGDTTLRDAKRKVAALQRISKMTIDQLYAGLVNFPKITTAAYMAVQMHHKEMRETYQGLGREKNENFESMLMKFLGQKPEDEKKDIKGPKIALVNDNCFLTDTLIDISERLPRQYETSVPGKNGRTKIIKKIDDYDVESFARSLAHAANPVYMGYLRDPNTFPAAIAMSIESFYKHYRDLEPYMRAVVDALQDSDLVMVAEQEDLKKSMPDPRAIVGQLRSLSYMSIRPSEEEVQPRTKMEKDYSKVRTKLLTHLKNMLDNLEKMPEDEKLAESQKYVRAAITLKTELDDIQRTEKDRRLLRNIRDENEFYVGKTGEIGSFETEREPAPRIKYDDVFGQSFLKAREHVEEVIDLASYPQILKATAPRGKIKSNLLLIGPYGCGKTEFARAVAADKRVVGLYVSVADVLTAYMHESVKNVKRVWEEGKRLRMESRYTKPVAVIQDEFNGWFEQGDRGFRHSDEQQMQMVMQEVLDGIVDYDGIFTIALTNKPGVIPDAILRRFKYVDVVGQLTREERAKLFKRFLTRGMPVSEGIGEADYMTWAEALADAPGDVIGKVADEVHFKFIKEYKRANPQSMERLEKYLQKIENNRELTKREYERVKDNLRSYRDVQKDEIQTGLDYMIKQPSVQKMINAAKQVYKEADKIMTGLMEVGDTGMGFSAKSKSRIWTAE